MSRYIQNASFGGTAVGTVATSDSVDNVQDTIAHFYAAYPDSTLGDGRPWTITSDGTSEVGGRFVRNVDNSVGDVVGFLQYLPPGTIPASTSFEALYRFRLSAIGGFVAAGMFLGTSAAFYGLQVESDGDVGLWYFQSGNRWSQVGSTIAKGLAVDTWYWARVRRESDNEWKWKVWAGNFVNEPDSWDDEGNTDTTLTSGPIGVGMYDNNSDPTDYDWFSAGTEGDTAPGPDELPDNTVLGPAVIRRPWTRQSIHKTYGVDRSNPLTRGIIAAWTPPMRLDAASNQPFADITKWEGGLGTIQYGGQSIVAADFEADVDDTIQLRATGFSRIFQGDHTIFTVVKIRVTQGDGSRYVFAGSGPTNWFGLQRQSIGTLRINWDDNVTNTFVDSTLNQGTDDVVAVWAYREGSTYHGDFHDLTDNVRDTDTAAVNNNFTITGDDDIISIGHNRWDPVTEAPACSVGFVFAWNRALSAVERAAVEKNPWQIFKPKTIYIGKPKDRRVVVF